MRINFLQITLIISFILMFSLKVFGDTNIKTIKIKTNSEHDIESSIKKVKKQKKTLKISAFINAGMGGYLLLNHCNPPVKKIGCILGPLALSQAYIHYNQSKKMGEIENNLSTIEPVNVNTLTKNTSKNKTNDSSKNEPQLIVNGKPISEVTFPCPGDKGGTKCVLEQDGTTIRPLDEGQKMMSISQLAGIKPSGKKAQKVLSAALKKQKKLMEAAKKIDPDFNPVSNLSDGNSNTAGSLPFMTNMDSGEGSLTGNDLSPSATTIPHKEEGEKADTSVQNNFPFVGGVAGDPEGEAYSGGYEEDFEEVIGDEEEDIEAEVQKLLDKFAGKKDEKKTDVTAKKPLSFGKNEKISQSGISLFNVIKERYQKYINREEFIKKSQQKRNPSKSK